MNSIIEQKKEQIIALCKQHFVKELAVFGSITTNEFDDKSDIDLLYVFDITKINVLDYADNYFSFQESLEKITGRQIDLVSKNDISNPVFKRTVEQSKILLYAA